MSMYIVFTPCNEINDSVGTVFGVGADEAEAWTDAEKWCDDTEGLLSAECSAEVAEKVRGGNPEPAVELVDGVWLLLKNANTKSIGQ